MSRSLKLAVVAVALATLGGGAIAAYRYLPWFGRKPALVAAGSAQSKAEAPAPGAVAPAPERPSESAEPPSGPNKGGAAPVAAVRSQSPVAVPGTHAEGAGEARERDDQLIRLYEGMRPKEAAAVMGRLDPDLSTVILLGMRERQAAKILGLLSAEKAADLTARIARAMRGKGGELKAGREMAPGELKAGREMVSGEPQPGRAKGPAR